MIAQLIKINKGVIGNDQAFPFRAFHFLVDEDGSGIRIQCCVVVFRMVHKGQVAGFNHMYLVQAADHMIGIANKFCIKKLADLLQALCCWKFHDLRFSPIALIAK